MPASFLSENACVGPIVFYLSFFPLQAVQDAVSFARKIAKPEEGAMWMRI